MRNSVSTLLLLAAIAALAIAAKPLPRGDNRFHLGMTRPELESRLAARRVETLSVGRNNLAVTSDDPAVEFERYSIVPLKAMDVVAEVTIAYRMPFDRSDFRAVCDSLERKLGKPHEHLVPVEGDGTQDKESVSWTDGRVLVRLTARWKEQPDPLSDRMTVVWSDIQLRQALLGNQAGSQKSKP